MDFDVQKTRKTPVSFDYSFGYSLIRESTPGIPDQNLEAFPVIAALEAAQHIRELLEKDRTSGHPDHAKEAYEIAREAKIVSPVSSLLMVDAKKEQQVQVK